MAAEIPAHFRDLLETKAFAHLATLMPDGSPQVTPVWVDLHDGYVRVNSAKGRMKDKNMRRDRRVSLSIQDPQNPYRYLEIRGKVVEVTQQGAADHINRMAKKYLGKDTYPWSRPGEVRVLYRIQPEKFNAMG